MLLLFLGEFECVCKSYTVTRAISKRKNRFNVPRSAKEEVEEEDDEKAEEKEMTTSKETNEQTKERTNESTP